MDKRTPFRASLIAAALASVAGLAGAAVEDNTGSRLRSNTGECVGNVYSPDCPPAAVAPDGSRPSSAVRDSQGEIAALESDAMGAERRLPAESGYVTDNMGAVARSNTGSCVTSNTGVAANAGVIECGGVLAQAAPVVPPAPAAEMAPREIPLQRITLDTDTTFGFDSAELSEEGKEQLDSIVEAAEDEDVARLRIHVTGYADRIGTEEYNKDLSERRAETVREYFVQAGVPADVITAEGRGEANPVVQCEGMSGIGLIECLRPNRRSEVEFAALERAEPGVEQRAPEEPSVSDEPQPWTPGTDTGTPR